MASYQPSIYDLANLQQMQTGLAPLVAIPAARAELEREKLIRQMVLEKQLQLDAVHMDRSRANALAELSARTKSTAEEAQKDRDFRHKEGSARDEADLKRALAVQKDIDERTQKIDSARAKAARDKYYREKGVDPQGKDESDEAFEKRALNQLRSEAKEGMGSLSAQVQDLEKQRIDISARAEQQRLNDIERAVRAQLQITPQNAAVELAKPAVQAEYSSLKTQLLKEYPLSPTARAELASIERQIKAVGAMYDDAFKEYRTHGGGLKELFPERKASTPGSSSLFPLPPATVGIGNARAMEGGRSDLAPVQVPAAAPAAVDYSGLSGLVPLAGAATQSIRNKLGNVFGVGGDLPTGDAALSPEQRAIMLNARTVNLPDWLSRFVPSLQQAPAPAPVVDDFIPRPAMAPESVMWDEFGRPIRAPIYDR